MMIPFKKIFSVGTYTVKALRNWRLCQCSNRLFPVPLACLCRSNKRVGVVAAYHARVMSDARHFQKRLAAFVNGNGLEMTESIAHEIDGGAFHRQCFCAFIAKDDGDSVEEHRWGARQLSA